MKQRGDRDLHDRIERLTDLVRFARRFLHEAELISDEEFAALVIDSDSGQRVARLEGYDRLRENLRQALAERDALAGWIREIGRIAEQEQVAEICRKAIDGTELPPDSARWNAVEMECADVELTCGGVWRVSSVDGDFEAMMPRAAVDKMIAAMVARIKPTEVQG
jgi:hypothetical protein